jgi:hypothetical protein
MKQNNIKMSYNSALIDDYNFEIPLDAGKKFRVVGDKEDNTPLIFSIGSEDHLNLSLQKSETQTGWELIHLTEIFQGSKVSTFECVSDENNRYVKIAVALKNSSGQTELYLTDRIDTYSFDWEATKKAENNFWKKQNIEDDSANIDLILLDMQKIFIATSKN